MEKLFDKLLLLCLCLWFAFSQGMPDTAVIALLTAAIVSALCSYLSGRALSVLPVVYTAAALFWLPLLLFLPLIAYDLMILRPRPMRLLWLAVILPYLASGQFVLTAGAVLLSILAMTLYWKTAAHGGVLFTLHQVQDSTKEKALYLERKNRELMEKQDYEVQLATLAERNRIAREIHDNVGHLLTRSLLQVGALKVVHQKDSVLSEELEAVNTTLADAMDHVRKSVHNLHEEAADLKLQLEALTANFHFCPIVLRFEAENPPPVISYCMIAVVREALSNIARHSNATEVKVTVLEHPALYQLIIGDNGTAFSSPSREGIGLSNMQERVEALHGIFRIRRETGFEIFISIPKEKGDLA